MKTEAVNGPHSVALPLGEKLLIAALMCLEIPFAFFFFPLAAVLVLTGFLAPFGVMSFALGRMPFTLAMARRNTENSSPSEKSVPSSHD